MYPKSVIIRIFLILLYHYCLVWCAAVDELKKADISRARRHETLPAPLIQPLDNFFAYSLKITLSKQCRDECCRNAEIIYTIDGTDPRTSPAADTYETPFTISSSSTVKVFLKAMDSCRTNSDVSEKRFNKIEPLPLPAVSPKESRVDFGREISICVKGFEHDTMVHILYTLDGSDPATAGTRYNGPFGLHKSCMLRAIAIHKAGLYLNSPIYYTKYTCSIALSPEPKAAPPSTNFTDTISVSLTAPGFKNDDDMIIYYTIDGTEPTIIGKMYKKPITLNNTTELKMLAFKSGLQQSRTVSELYARGTMPVVPKATVVPRGDFYGGVMPPLTLKCDAERAMVMYTIDGSEPSMASELWSGKPVILSGPATLKVKVFKTDWVPSVTVTEKYDYENLPEPAPDFPGGTVFPDSLGVTLTVPGFINEAGLQIFYTLDGSSPQKSGKQYREKIILKQSCLLKTFARSRGYYDSDIGAYEYFNMIQVVRAYYQDRDRDGRIETAVLCFNKKLAALPSSIEFTDPITMAERNVSSSDGSFSIDPSGNCMIISFKKPFAGKGGFVSGHYGRIPLPGEYDTSPFLVYDSTKHSVVFPNNKNETGADNSVARISKGNVEIINNPFKIGISILPKNIQSLNDFRTETGISVSLKPKYPSAGYADIYDKRGNQVVFKKELIADPATGALYLVWDGKDSRGGTVESGTYAVVLAIEEKQSSIMTSKKVHITVNK